MKPIIKSLLLLFLVPLIVVAVVLGVLGSRALLENFSYETRAWEYLYMQPLQYLIGYVAQEEQTGPEETLTVDVYAAVSPNGILEDGGVFLYTAAEGFAISTDCKQIICAGEDGYEASDFGWESFFNKHLKIGRRYHMTDLPFHFQLYLTPTTQMEAGAEGSIHVVVIPFGPEDDPGDLDGAELVAWVEKQLGHQYPNGIEIPYYFDGNDFYWSPNIINKQKA